MPIRADAVSCVTGLDLRADHCGAGQPDLEFYGHVAVHHGYQRHFVCGVWRRSEFRSGYKRASGTLLNMHERFYRFSGAPRPAQEREAQARDELTDMEDTADTAEAAPAAKPKLLDTSVIIDGRVFDVAKRRLSGRGAGGAAVCAGRAAPHCGQRRHASPQPRTTGTRPAARGAPGATVIWRYGWTARTGRTPQRPM